MEMPWYTSPNCRESRDFLIVQSTFNAHRNCENPDVISAVRKGNAKAKMGLIRQQASERL